jgi:TPR repeat protein
MEKHLLQAAERGDAEAQFNLGVMDENGVANSRYAIEGTRSEAVRWLLAAAEQGLPRAHVKLAEIYGGFTEFSDAVRQTTRNYVAVSPYLSRHSVARDDTHNSAPGAPAMG